MSEKSIVVESEPVVTWSSRLAVVFAVIEAETGTGKAALVGEQRTRDVTHVRHVAQALAIKFLPERSLASMARQFNRDHTSVLAAVRTVAHEVICGGERGALFVRLEPLVRAAMMIHEAGQRVVLAVAPPPPPHPPPPPPPPTPKEVLAVDQNYNVRMKTRAGYIDRFGQIICLW